MNKLENIRRDLRFDPGAAYSLGKCNRILGHNLAIKVIVKIVILCFNRPIAFSAGL